MHYNNYWITTTRKKLKSKSASVQVYKQHGSRWLLKHSVKYEIAIGSNEAVEKAKKWIDENGI